MSKVDNATFLQAQAEARREYADRLDAVADNLPDHKTITRRLCGEYTYISDSYSTKYFVVLGRKPYSAAKHNDDGTTEPAIYYSNDNSEQFGFDEGTTPEQLRQWARARAASNREHAAKLEEFLEHREAVLEAVKAAAEVYRERVDGLPWEVREAYSINHLTAPWI